MSAFTESLQQRAAAARRRILFPESLEPRTLAAVAELQRTALVQPLLVGGAETVCAALRDAGGDGDAVTVLEPARHADLAELTERFYERRKARGVSREAAARLVLDPLTFGGLMLESGEADGCVAGAVHATADVLRAALTTVGPAPGIRMVSSAFYMEVSDFRGAGPEVLTFTDAGVVPDPDDAALADIACAAAQARRAIVGDEPVVAFLSYSTYGSAEGPSVQKVRAALKRFRERMPDVAADGELQADAALIADVGARKAPHSPVAGRANVLVFPDLDAGNIAYKLVQRLAGAGAYGPIVQGLARPYNDLSRGAVASDIVRVACITALQA